MKDLFVQLIWPAAAGNVAWSFFAVAVNEEWSEPGVLARLALLLLVSCYLVINLLPPRD